MICKICGTDIREAAFCPMCGAKAGTTANENSHTENCSPEHRYKYRGIDADSTTVLTNRAEQKAEKNQFENNKSGNRDDIKKPSAVQNADEFRVVTDTPVKENTSKKKKIIVGVFIGVLALLIALAAVVYAWIVNRNPITYYTKTLYYQEDARISNINGNQVDYASCDNAKIVKKDYANGRYLLEDSADNQMLLASKNGVTKIADSKGIQQILYGNQLNRFFYFTTEEEDTYSLYEVTDDGEKEITAEVPDLLSSAISENGEYMAYSYCKDKASYVVSEVLPSGEVNQIADLDASIDIVYVSNEGKIFGSLLQEKKNDDDKESYLIYEVQEKQTRGTAYLGLQYFGYYEKLNSYVMEDADNNLYYVGMSDEGEEKLLASGVEWFMDISEPEEYENVCNKEVSVSPQRDTAMQTKAPVILYYKDKTLYCYDVLNSKESEKIADDVTDLNSIQVWNNNQILYLNHENLYKAVMESGKWAKSILIHKNCSEFQYMPSADSVVYLADKTLYSYENGKETLLADAVESFDLDAKNEALLYSTGSSLVYKKNMKAEKQEYHVASEGAVYLIDKTAYYTGIDGTFSKMILKTSDKEAIVKNPDEVTVIWR